ncbi:MAG: hypothetical protein AB1705_05625 [Verrucomicrobiota bacterium]
MTDRHRADYFSFRLSVARSAFHAFRLAERLCPPGLLRALACLGAVPCAAFDLPRRADWQSGLARLAGWPEPAARAAYFPARLRFHLQRVLASIPDRLGQDHWRVRCRLQGHEFLQAALDARRPVILATLHFGGLVMHRDWLRTFGIPAATFLGEPIHRHALKRLKHSLAPFPHIPCLLTDQNLRTVLRFLQSGVLVALVDHPAGRPIHAPVPGGMWRVSSTAWRLAALADAVVIPFLTTETAPWQFTLHFGEPLPAAASPAGFPAVASQLWTRVQPVLAATPDQCHQELFDSLDTPLPVLAT